MPYGWAIAICMTKTAEPQESPAALAETSPIDAPTADAHNVVWAVDFQFDICEQDKMLKICSIVDEHTREC